MQKPLYHTINPYGNIEDVYKEFKSYVINDIDISRNYPYPLNKNGELLLTDPYFWIFFIRIKIYSAQKEKKHSTFINKVNLATKYEIINRHILYDYYTKMIDLFFDRNALKDKICKIKNCGFNYTLTKKDYGLLLKDKEFFQKENYKKMYYNYKEVECNELYLEIIKEYNENNVIVNEMRFSLGHGESGHDSRLMTDCSSQFEILAKKRIREGCIEKKEEKISKKDNLNGTKIRKFIVEKNFITNKGKIRTKAESCLSLQYENTNRNKHHNVIIDSIAYHLRERKDLK